MFELLQWIGWKALSGCLIDDERIQQVGVAMVSRCNCCLVGHEENSDHILSTVEFVDEVWRRLSSSLGIRWRSKQAWWDRINIWWACARRSSRLGCLQGLLPCLVTWIFNVDGSSFGNPGQSGRDGVIRNDQGMVLAAFATSFGIVTNNEAELRAIIEVLDFVRN